MPSSPTAGFVDVPEPVTRPSRWRLLIRVALLIGVVLIVAMWAGIFLGLFDKRAPGTLDDATFPQRAAPVCAATKAQLDALPKAFETPDHVQRADVVAQSNVALRAMLAQLQPLAPTAGRDGRMSQEWLADWSTYVGDREDYATRLRADPSARFYETPKSSESEQISKPISRFAYVNDMDACDTPQDMA